MEDKAPTGTEMDKICPLYSIIKNTSGCARQFVSAAMDDLEEIITKTEDYQKKQSSDVIMLNGEKDYELMEIITQCHIVQNYLISALRSLEGLTTIST